LDLKNKKTGFLRIYSFPMFSGEFFHWNVVFEGIVGIPVFDRCHRIFCRNSCGTGIPYLLRFIWIPPDSSRFLFPPNAVWLRLANKFSSY
jgi:hypothetical protein